MVNKIWRILVFSLLVAMPMSAQDASVQAFRTKNEFFRKLQQSMITGTDAETDKLVEQAIIRYPESFMSWYYAGKQAMKEENYMEAYEYLLQAKELSDEDYIDYMLIEVYDQVGEYDNKLETIKKLWVKSPYNSRLFHQYIGMLYSSGRYQDYYDMVKDGLKNGYTVGNSLGVHVKNINQLIKKGKIEGIPLSF